MRLLCIDVSNPVDYDALEKCDYIYVGEIYQWEETIFSISDGREYFHLKERPKKANGKRVRYGHWRFAIVPEDKTEEVEHKVEVNTPLLKEL